MRVLLHQMALVNVISLSVPRVYRQTGQNTQNWQSTSSDATDSLLTANTNIQFSTEADCTTSTQLGEQRMLQLTLFFIFCFASHKGKKCKEKTNYVWPNGRTHTYILIKYVLCEGDIVEAASSFELQAIKFRSSVILEHATMRGIVHIPLTVYINAYLWGNNPIKWGSIAMLGILQK